MNQDELWKEVLADVLVVVGKHWPEEEEMPNELIQDLHKAVCSHLSNDCLKCKHESNELYKPVTDSPSVKLCKHCRCLYMEES